MFFKKRPFADLEAALEEAKERQLDHQDQADFHQKMNEYYGQRIARIAAALGHDQKKVNTDILFNRS